MQDLLSSNLDWRGKRVLVTGHTGFMGGWLSLWLGRLGAQVYGYSLAPPTTPSLYDDIRLRDTLAGEAIADIRDIARLRAAVAEWRPEIVFHLAAQPLVRLARREPRETFDVNVMGTVNVLDALRDGAGLRGIVVITSDKVYDNVEWAWAYRENDRLGGHEPYGVSKACAELVVEAYRAAHFAERGIGIATVRAGNIIGGGDWALDRLIPDIVRAFVRGDPVTIRNPASTRPWQHVMEPVAGYFKLASAVVSHPDQASGGWNFGPRDEDHKPVEWIVSTCARLWSGGATWNVDGSNHPYEAKRLGVTYAKSERHLGWAPVLRLEDALRLSIDWYRAREQGAEMRQRTLADIDAYEAARTTVDGAPAV